MHVAQGHVTRQLYTMAVSFVFLSFFFLKFIYFESKRKCEQGRGRERIPTRFHTVSKEPIVGLDPTNLS